MYFVHLLYGLSADSVLFLNLDNTCGLIISYGQAQVTNQSLRQKKSMYVSNVVVEQNLRKLALGIQMRLIFPVVYLYCPRKTQQETITQILIL